MLRFLQIGLNMRKHNNLLIAGLLQQTEKPQRYKLLMEKIYLNFQQRKKFFLVYLFTYLCIYFWLLWVFVAARGLSLVAAGGGYSSLQHTGFSLRWLLLLRRMGPRCTGFSSCGTWAQQLWLAGLVAPRHVGSSQIRARTRVPCIGRRILNYCTTREVREKF